MLAASAARLTVSRPIRSSIRFAAWGIASVLLAKTVRSSTFKLALFCIVIFGAAVFALFGYVYWSTASYVRGRSDQAITAENAILQKAFADRGRAGLIAAIAQRIADNSLEGGVYLLVDSSLAAIAGNLRAWPPALAGDSGWRAFSAPEWRP